MESESGKSGCRMMACNESKVAVFAGLDVCLDHFFERCFERLDKLEAALCWRSPNPAELRSLQEELEECSNQALVICLRQEALSNLERSRLLGILLQCGDLRHLLRKHTRTSAHSA